HHITLLRLEPLLEKFGKVDFTDKAQPLRIFLARRNQSDACSDRPYFGLAQFAEWKQGTRELFLRELTEEIALVLIAVFSREQLVHGLTVHNSGCLACIVTGSDKLCAEFQCGVKKDIELDLAVAQDIRIGCTSTLVFTEHVVDNAFLVWLAEIDSLKGDSQVLGYDHGVIAVVQPRAFLTDRNRVVVPVFHKNPDDVVALFLQQVGGNT